MLQLWQFCVICYTLKNMICNFVYDSESHILKENALTMTTLSSPISLSISTFKMFCFKFFHAAIIIDILLYVLIHNASSWIRAYSVQTLISLFSFAFLNFFFHSCFLLVSNNLSSFLTPLFIIESSYNNRC